jgi:uncharacterized membrane protein YcaP (DUF421 family)
MSANFAALLKPPRARLQIVMVMMAVVARGEIHDASEYTRAEKARQEPSTQTAGDAPPASEAFTDMVRCAERPRARSRLAHRPEFKRQFYRQEQLSMHSKMWSDMFVLALPVAEKILRPIVIYLFLVIGLRLAGKRELAQLNPFDLVVLLTLSNTVQNAIIGDDNSITGGVIGAATLLLLNFLVVRFLFRHEKLDRIVEGEPAVLMEHGKIVQEMLTREVLTLPELETAAHKQGFGSLAEVDRATLDPSGMICFTAKKPAPEESRHRELLEKMNEITRELAALRLRTAPPPA